MTAAATAAATAVDGGIMVAGGGTTAADTLAVAYASSLDGYRRHVAH